MSKQFPAIFLSALLSSVIFLIIAVNNLDFILMFVSIIPLFSLGLSKNPKLALESGVLAVIPIFLFSGGALSPAAMYFFVFALPCWYVCHLALRNIKIDSPAATMTLWYPTGLITVNLALYGCMLLAVATAIFATQDTNLPQFIANMAKDVIAELDSKYEIPATISPMYLAFILCSSMAWLWCFLMFGCAWFVNYTLFKKNMAVRPDFTIHIFPMPHWLLTLMGICGLASIIGGESMNFLGKSSLFILLIPYFFLGAAILNSNATKVINSMFFIFICYFIAIITFWPAMVVVGIGMWNHIKILNKHLSSGGSSSRN
ncbi:MAG: hypothetical protein AABY33_03200 [Pseudomonadota bacterium]